MVVWDARCSRLRQNRRSSGLSRASNDKGCSAGGLRRACSPAFALSLSPVLTERPRARLLSLKGAGAGAPPHTLPLLLPPAAGSLRGAAPPTPRRLSRRLPGNGASLGTAARGGPGRSRAANPRATRWRLREAWRAAVGGRRRAAAAGLRRALQLPRRPAWIPAAASRTPASRSKARPA